MDTSYRTDLGKLYSSEQILDFRAGHVTKLPDWLGSNLKLIMGAGDHAQIGDVPNIEYFSMFDVFLCLPENIGTDLLRNVELLTTRYRNQKVITFIDIADTTQVTNFVNLFAERFILIDGHVGHTPHFTIKQYEKLLVEGGRALDIYEVTHGLMSATQYEQALNGEFLSVKTRFNSKVYNGSKNHTLSNATRDKLVPKLKREIEKLTNGSDVLDDSILEIIDSESNRHQITHLGKILQLSLLLKTIPITLKPKFEFVTREWSDINRLELVLIKRTPEEFEEVSKYRNALGANNPDVQKAEMLIQKIKNNVRLGSEPFMQHAKRATLRKVINTKLKPRMTAGTRRRRANRR